MARGCFEAQEVIHMDDFPRHARPIISRPHELYELPEIADRHDRDSACARRRRLRAGPGVPLSRPNTGVILNFRPTAYPTLL
jgi:hypothetical protein